MDIPGEDMSVHRYDVNALLLGKHSDINALIGLAH
jgi:hypothetical protein